jgi:predicted type IV restriction endonuclease
MDRNGPPPRPGATEGRGDQQMMFEAVACLLARDGTNQVIISSAERWLLYDYFKKGFGLTCYQDPETSDLVLTLTDENSNPALLDLMKLMKGDRILGHRVPDYLKGRRKGGGRAG